MTNRKVLLRMFRVRRDARRIGDRVAWLNINGQIRLALKRGWRHA